MPHLSGAAAVDALAGMLQQQQQQQPNSMGGSMSRHQHQQQPSTSSTWTAPLLPSQQQQQPSGRSQQQQQQYACSSAAAAGSSSNAASSSMGPKKARYNNSVSLNKMIMAAYTSKHLLELVRDKGGQFDFFNISSAIARVPKLTAAHNGGMQVRGGPGAGA
jgi:hypothetical protein